jgi:hypothetical protein
MACSLSQAPLASLALTGQEHGRTIPLADIAGFFSAALAPWMGSASLPSMTGLALFFLPRSCRIEMP